MKRIVLAVVAALLCLQVCFAASAFTGTFKSKEGTIVLNEVAPGKFTGQFVANGQTLAFTAQEKGGALSGALNLADENLDFRMTLKGRQLTLVLEDESSVFTKDESPSSSASTAPEARSSDVKATSTSRAEKAHTLRVNGVDIDDKTVRKFERENRVKLPQGDFWYDKVSGAWGVSGGPTIGFTAPGIVLGGPLAADASRGDTGVFINNRELPQQDVAGLQQLGVPVQRGRWWVDNRGNFGVEGNPATVGNLFQFSQSKGGAYQRATAGGYIGGDGRTSYFFDPKSGSSVMVGN